MLYNQRYIKSSRINLSNYIYNYVHYIAENSNSKVVFSKGKEHGLFGCVGSKQIKHIESLSETINYIRKKAIDEKCILFHGFISLSADEVQKFSYQKREKWEDLIASKMHVIAKENNIKLSNLEWVSAYHMKKEHSHCHIIFWDKNQQIKQPFVNKALFTRKMEKIKHDFSKEVYQQEYKELYKLKDEAFAGIQKGLNPILDSFKDVIANMKDEDIKNQHKMFSAISSSFSDYDTFNPNFTNEQLNIITKEIMRISKIVPKSGSLKYGYMSDDIKKELDKTVANILSCNKACSRAYHNYINSAVKIRNIYSDNPASLKHAESEAVKVINRNVGNMLLKAIKDLKNIQASIPKSEYTANSKIYREETASDLIVQIAFALSRGANSNEAKVHTITNDELSKQAKIELAKKLESKGIDWGQYER